MGSGFGRWLWRERQRAKSRPHPHPAARGRLSPPPLGPAGEARPPPHPLPWAGRDRLPASRGTEGFWRQNILDCRACDGGGRGVGIGKGGTGGIACPLLELCRQGPPSGWGGRPRAQLSLGEVRGWGKGPPAWGAGPATPARPLSCSGLLNCPFMRAPLLPPSCCQPSPTLSCCRPSQAPLSPPLPCLPPLSAALLGPPRRKAPARHPGAPGRPATLPAAPSWDAPVQPHPGRGPSARGWGRVERQDGCPCPRRVVPMNYSPHEEETNTSFLKFATTNNRSWPAAGGETGVNPLRW